VRGRLPKNVTPALPLLIDMLELSHVTKLYSAIPAVKDVSFVAHAGKVTGYLGPTDPASPPH
jgi:ABC-type uncharacterized transport system ATPase subunit